MKPLFIQTSLLAFLIMLIACQEDSLVPETLSNEDFKIETRAKKHPVPFHATFVSTAAVFPPLPNEDVCGTGEPVFNILQTLEGHATHMGLISGTTSACVDPTTTPFTLFNSFITLIAANGDELYFEVPGLYTGTLDIVGGTGRFLNATGIVSGGFEEIEGSFPPSFNNTFDGNIQY